LPITMTSLFPILHSVAGNKWPQDSAIIVTLYAILLDVYDVN